LRSSILTTETGFNNYVEGACNYGAGKQGQKVRVGIPQAPPSTEFSCSMGLLARVSPNSLGRAWFIKCIPSFD